MLSPWWDALSVGRFLCGTLSLWDVFSLYGLGKTMCSYLIIYFNCIFPIPTSVHVCLSSSPTDLAREKWANAHCKNFRWNDENFCHFQKYIILAGILDWKIKKIAFQVIFICFQVILICARQKKHSTLWHCQYSCLGFWNPRENLEIWRYKKKKLMIFIN